MFTKTFIAVYLCGVLGSCYSLTIFPNTEEQTFAIQYPNTENENSFFRINRDSLKEFLTCPDGFSFHIEDLKCKISKPKRLYNSAQNGIACPEDFRGTLVNSLNCRTFLDCWDGREYEMPCAAHLLYSNNTERCELPETANCCEFWEHNQKQIVSNM